MPNKNAEPTITELQAAVNTALSADGNGSHAHLAACRALAEAKRHEAEGPRIPISDETRSNFIGGPAQPSASHSHKES